MERKRTLLEANFLIPLREDNRIGNGNLHSPLRWAIFERKIRLEFKGITKAPGTYKGYDEDDIYDLSRKYIVAVERGKLNRLRDLLKQAARTFKQKSIYLSIAGEVEFVKGGSR